MKFPARILLRRTTFLILINVGIYGFCFSDEKQKPITCLSHRGIILQTQYEMEASL